MILYDTNDNHILIICYCVYVIDLIWLNYRDLTVTSVE